MLKAPDNILGTKWNSPCGERNYTVVSVVDGGEATEKLALTIENLDGEMLRNMQYVTYEHLTDACTEIKQ